MTSGARTLIITGTFFGLWVAVYNAYVWSQPLANDLSDVGTGLVGLGLGLVGSTLGAAVAALLTSRRRD